MRRDPTSREVQLLAWLAGGGFIVPAVRHHRTVHDLLIGGRRVTGVQARTVSRLVDAAWIVAPLDSAPVYRITEMGRAAIGHPSNGRAAVNVWA